MAMRNADIDPLLRAFRLASRELFNQFFKIPDPYDQGGWELQERFSEVEALLFEKMVLTPASLNGTEYGDPQPRIGVVSRVADTIPIMINREKVSGYWDHPLRETSIDAEFSFVRFFDWDLLEYRDNRYVRVRIEGWPSHSEVVGRHALLESNDVKFILR